MGWSSGSSLLCEVVQIIENHVTEQHDLPDLYDGLILAFEAYDCDTLDECEGLSADFDDALKRAGYNQED